jgi:nucleotide-binding universal stress UspA family protein
MKLERIFFPTDFSEASNEALDRAVALAAAHGAKLRIFHAERFGHDADALAARRAEIDERIERLRPRLRDGTAPEVQYGSVEASDAGGAILGELAKSPPDLVVMATHGGGVLTQSVAEQVVRDAPCSVLTCRRRGRGRWPLEPGRVVVPVDFSDNSRRALDAARAWAGDRCAITLVHVVDTPRHPSLYDRSIVSPFRADPELRGRIEDHLRQWAGEPVDQVIAVEGEVRTALLDECRRVSAILVVIGTRGSHSMPEHALGSTAERLTRTASAPVLTVR